MGDYFPTYLSRKKPVQVGISSKLIKKELDINLVNLSFSEKSSLIQNLNKLTIYINSDPLDNTKFDFSYKQFTSNINIGNSYQELHFNKVINILENLYNSEIVELNISGGNLLKYSKLKQIIEFLNKLDIPTSYYFKYKNILTNKNTNIFLNLSKSNSTIKIIIDNFHSMQEIKKINDLFSSIYSNTKFVFLITDEKTLENSEKAINSIKFSNFQFLPLYIKENIEFFRNNVFFEEEDIFESKINQINIFQNQEINMFDFGSLIILPNGNVYTNVNSEKIGNIRNDKITDLLYDCITLPDKNWILTRNKINPCKDCLYNALCPPISNYERIIKQFNLCNVAIN
jgi:pseudo-rSAM protein